MYRFIFFRSVFFRLGTKWSFDQFLTSSIFVPPYFNLLYAVQNAKGYTLMQVKIRGDNVKDKLSSFNCLYDSYVELT